jgi:Skp family chaperone for outer membrane proteins
MIQSVVAASGLRSPGHGRPTQQQGVLKVKFSRILAVSAAGLLCLAFVVTQVFSQGLPPRQGMAPQAGNPPNIALLDVSFIFKNHPRFNALMEEMKNDVKRAEEDVNREGDSMRKLAEKLDGYIKGSQDYKQLEEEMAKKEAELRVKVTLQRKTFLEREAKIYHNVYQEIAQQVDYYCTNKGIGIVLRFNGDPVDVNKPDSVLSYINKPVVWYEKSRDITPDILDALIKRGGVPAANNRIGSPMQRPGGNSPFQK